MKVLKRFEVGDVTVELKQGEDKALYVTPNLYNDRVPDVVRVGLAPPVLHAAPLLRYPLYNGWAYTAGTPVLKARMLFDQNQPLALAHRLRSRCDEAKSAQVLHGRIAGLIKQQYSLVRHALAAADPAVLRLCKAVGHHTLEAYNWWLCRPHLHNWAVAHPWLARRAYTMANSGPFVEPERWDYRDFFPQNSAFAKSWSRRARWHWRWGAPAVHGVSGFEVRHVELLDIPELGKWVPKPGSELRVIGLIARHVFDRPSAVLVRKATEWIAASGGNNGRPVPDSMQIVQQWQYMRDIDANIPAAEWRSPRHLVELVADHLGGGLFHHPAVPIELLPIPYPDWAFVDVPGVLRRLATHEDFLAERTKMHHCIDIYAKTASRGQAQYYHVTAPSGKEYTVEQHAVSREKEVWLGQIKSHCNTDPTVEDRRFVRQLFTNGTQQPLQPGAQAAIPACHEVLDDDDVMF